MSASSLPLSSLPFLVPPSVAQSMKPKLSPGRRGDEARLIVRRRASMQQGKGLEVLGHAIEYLVDSRMFLVGEPGTPAEAEAVQVLSRCSRELFASCAPVVPVGQRLRRWVAERLHVTGQRDVAQVPLI